MLQTRLYAIGDIHGRSDLLDKLHALIAEHAAHEMAERRVLVYLGDYIDRGPDPKGVIERVRSSLAGFETVALKGNHEALMLDALDQDTPSTTDIWMKNGGGETLASFGIDATRRSDPQSARERIGSQIVKWLRDLPTSWRAGGFFFAHAGVRPGVPLDRQTPEDLLWIRKAFTESDADFGLRIVHGHSPVEEPQVRPNRIGIDTGAVWTGRLTAAALDPDRAQAAPEFLITQGPDLESINRALQAPAR